MVEEAERYKAEDDVQKSRVEGKNSLENYAYSMRNTINDEKLADKLDAADKSTIESKISETIAWLDANQNAEKEEYEKKQKELEGVCNPIIQKMAGGAGGMPSGMPGGMPDMGGAGFPGGGAPAPEAEADAGPKIEEID
ncbi:unnamed protein product [Hapterophycus canaliculatus]